MRDWTPFDSLRFGRIHVTESLNKAGRGLAAIISLELGIAESPDDTSYEPKRRTPGEPRTRVGDKNTVDTHRTAATTDDDRHPLLLSPHRPAPTPRLSTATTITVQLEWDLPTRHPFQ